MGFDEKQRVVGLTGHRRQQPGGHHNKPRLEAHETAALTLHARQRALASPRSALRIHFASFCAAVSRTTTTHNSSLKPKLKAG